MFVRYGCNQRKELRASTSIIQPTTVCQTQVPSPVAKGDPYLTERSLRRDDELERLAKRDDQAALRIVRFRKVGIDFLEGNINTAHCIVNALSVFRFIQLLALPVQESISMNAFTRVISCPVGAPVWKEPSRLMLGIPF